MIRGARSPNAPSRSLAPPPKFQRHTDGEARKQKTLDSFNATDPNDPAAWQPVAYTSSSRCTVEALESGKFYWFRVQTLGRKGLLSPQSQVVRALAA